MGRLDDILTTQEGREAARLRKADPDTPSMMPAMKFIELHAPSVVSELEDFLCRQLKRKKGKGFFVWILCHAAPRWYSWARTLTGSDPELYSCVSSDRTEFCVYIPFEYRAFVRDVCRVILAGIAERNFCVLPKEFDGRFTITVGDYSRPVKLTLR